MDLTESTEKLIKYIQINLTKVYLILANIILVVFAIWFSNVGLIPFAKLSDFAFFAFISLVLGMYRPSWTFAFFIGTLALEGINIIPREIGISLRPYQFFGVVTIISLIVQMAAKRLVFPMPSWRWYDCLPIVFSLAGFLSSFGSINFSASFKQSVVAASFAALYYLVRIYVQSFEDLKRTMPFFISSGLVVVLYGILQNIWFLQGRNSYEVMPGRPNATFTEPDWYGIYLVFLLSTLLTIIFYLSKKTRISNYQLPIFNKFPNVSILKEACIYIAIIIAFLSLILTVSRSAWVGAAVVVAGFLSFILIDGSLKISAWRWGQFLLQITLIFGVLAISLVLASPLTNFQIFNRAASTGGLQKITIACPPFRGYEIPEKIVSIDDVAPCRLVNLEDIDKSKALGNIIFETYREDPSVNIRAEIYEKSIAEIKTHPILGLGWGSISSVLGNDERGAGLNASNIFMEIYLGSGMLGVVAFIFLLCIILIKGLILFFRQENEKITATFILLGWAAIVIPNLFNSGIFLGFVWVYLAVAVSFVAENKYEKIISKG